MKKVGINVDEVEQAFTDSFSRDGNNKYLQKST